MDYKYKYGQKIEFMGEKGVITGVKGFIDDFREFIPNYIVYFDRFNFYKRIKEEEIEEYGKIIEEE